MLDQIPTAEETEMSCIFKTKQFTILIERSAAETKICDLKMFAIWKTFNVDGFFFVFINGVKYFSTLW